MEKESDSLKQYQEYVKDYNKYVEDYKDVKNDKVSPLYPFTNYEYLCKIFPNGEVYDARTEIKSVQQQNDNCSYQGGHDLVTLIKKCDNSVVIKKAIIENVEEELKVYKENLKLDKKQQIIDKIVDKLATPFSESDKILKSDGSLSTKGKKELKEYVKKYMEYINSAK